MTGATDCTGAATDAIGAATDCTGAATDAIGAATDAIGAATDAIGGTGSFCPFATRSLSSHTFKSANCCFFLKQQGTHNPSGCTLAFKNPG